MASPRSCVACQRRTVAWDALLLTVMTYSRTAGALPERQPSDDPNPNTNPNPNPNPNPNQVLFLSGNLLTGGLEPLECLAMLRELGLGE